VVLSDSERRSPPAHDDPDSARAVIWHELECGSYTADLALWRELAESMQAGPQAEHVLDIGAGTGRVALDLAARGHEVCALELDAALLGALRVRAQELELELETICADARTFGLDRRDFALCIVSMQTIQLLGGERGRLGFLSRAAEHLRPGGVLACAIATTLEPFDCSIGELGPPTDRVRVDDAVYASRVRRVEIGPRSILIERERRISAAGPERIDHDLVALEQLSAAQLRDEAVAVGLTPLPDRAIAPTADHVGSEVVVLRA
jgi:SAM-dependent methyltransferase